MTSTNYVLKIDNREKDLIPIFQKNNIPFVNENLEIGDILISDDAGNTLIIIERKKYADLSASIKDGRYKEQKERLLHSLSRSVRKIYLLEGTDLQGFQFSAKTFESVVVNTMIRDQIMIHMTKTVLETAHFIEIILTNLAKYYGELKSEIVLGENVIFNAEYTCKRGKKDNITSQICFQNQLSQIPGISTKISEMFVEKYGNMNHFLKELGKSGTKEEIIKQIADEKFGAIQKKIGAKTAEKIYGFLF